MDQKLGAWKKMKSINKKFKVFLHSGGPLGEIARKELVKFLDGRNPVGFVSAADLGDEKAYFSRIQKTLSRLGIAMIHIQWNQNPLKSLSKAQAIYVGGGNTYALLWRLYRANLLKPIRECVQGGMPYIGSSAGSNLAGPTILTTNDWNVVGLSRFEALGLVPFNINPHYRETDLAMAPFSETRDDRIYEYHAINKNPVIGIEEGSMLVVEKGTVRVLGSSRAKLFRPGLKPVWFKSGEEISC